MRPLATKGPLPDTPTLLLVPVLCWAVVVLDGYDLIIYGATVPALLDEAAWQLSPRGAGVLASVGLVGMMIGALGAGALADAVGRRRVILWCTTWFSVWTAACALAPGPEVFGAFRFLAGLGLGGVLPTASALTIQHAPARYRTLVYTAVLSGIPLGGVLASTVSAVAVEASGWRPLYALALVALVTIVPAAWLALPTAHPDGGRRRTVREGAVALGRPELRPASTLFPLATIAVMLTWFGLSTWLPQIMRESGFDLGSALSFLLVLNLGGIVGSLVTAAIADRYDLRVVTVASFCTAVVVLAALAVQPPQLVLYVLVAVAGVCTHGTLCLLNNLVTSYYPTAVSATALGWSLGVGRLGAIAGPTLAGWVLGSALGVEWNFYLFSLSALVGGIAVALVQWRPGPARAAGEPVSAQPLDVGVIR